jgi:xanthine dehydrogenase iron-sulfur cluster and FAD-binding subunit A
VADGESLHPVQQAFLDYGAVQCGFCIPGMIISAKALIEKNPKPTQEEVEYALDGNICRCAGYPKIFDAVHKAAQAMRQGSKKIIQDNDKEKPRPQLTQMTCGITYEEYTKERNTAQEKK